LSRSNRNRSTHGHTRRLDKPSTKTYECWRGMRERCLNPRSKNFPQYGGRGIRVCERWQDFENFLADMGEKPVGTSIDRVDMNGNYELSNCRWVTSKDQARNRRTNIRLSISGETLCVKEWSERGGISYGTILDRISAGWDHKRAVFHPKRHKSPVTEGA
jgi:hypothetical protein